MLAQILSVIAALPKILELLGECFKFLKNTWGDTWPKYVADLGETFKNLNKAQSVEEKQAAAKDLAKLAQRWGQQD